MYFKQFSFYVSTVCERGNDELDQIINKKIKPERLFSFFFFIMTILYTFFNNLHINVV